ncbi:hypothetical protein HRbin15_01145 [bacterium HR15]|nr:hypothetical protein HRbin15_01145 [bacterium HR15]
MNQELQVVWNTVREKVKEKVTGRSLYQALDILTPIVMEGETLVLGMPAEHALLASHLNAPTVRRYIELFLEEAYGFRPQIVIIEGTTLNDWQLYQRKQEELRRLTEASMRKQAQEARAYTSWEAVYEQVGRAFAATPNRSLALSRARYLQEALQIVREAMQHLSLESEMDERQLNRIIERIATNVDAPAALIAWLLLQELKSEQP